MGEPDLAALQGAAALRVVIGLGVAAYGSAVGHPGHRATLFYLLVGLVWVPWASFLLLASDGRGRSLRIVGAGPVGDVLVLFAAQCLLPSANALIVLGDAVAVSFAAWVWTRRGAWMVALLSVSLIVVAQAFVPPAQRLGPAVVAVFAAAVAGMLVLVRRIVRRDRLAAESSRRLQLKADTILARAASGIIVTDAAGTITQCNPAGDRLIGNRSPVGLPCSEAVALRTNEGRLDCRAGCALLRLAAEGDDPSGREVWRVRGDGRRQSLLANVAPVTDPNGDVAEIIHSLRDISRLKEADEAKTLFLATASHELKTPLTVISGFVDAMRAFPEMPPEMREEALAAIHARATELGAIIERLLLSSKIEAGRVKVQLRRIDVLPLLKQRASTIATGNGHSIVVNVCELPLMAAADPLALGTVVDHLLDNAVKYSEGGLVVLGAEAAAGEVRLTVSDSGAGMDEDQAAHCFDKFWQAESTDVRRFGGTGIGLYIVQSLVEAMGGHISVESALGRGSRFTVALPASVVSTDEPTPGRALAPPQPLLAEQSSIREFMRQIGVPSGSRS